VCVLPERCLCARKSEMITMMDKVKVFGLSSFLWFEFWFFFACDRKGFVCVETDEEVYLYLERYRVHACVCSMSKITSI
jgi:hypothetical protein